MADLYFPTLVSSNWKMTRTPMFTTIVQKSASGRLTRAALQSNVLYKWTLKNGVLQSAPAIADLQAIETLFYSCFGQFGSFLWLDPEFPSLVPGTSSYFRVAFTSDTLDFDRFAYQLWELGKLEFQQVNTGPPVIIPSGPTTTSTVSSATLSVSTAFTNSTGAPANPTISASIGGVFGGASDSLHNSTYGQQTDSTLYDGTTFSIPTTSSLGGLTVTASIGGSLFSDGTLATFSIYDVSLTVNFADGTSATVRPTSATADSSAGTGTASNPQLAIDGNSGTAATITRTHYSGLSGSAFIVFSNFVVA